MLVVPGLGLDMRAGALGRSGMRWCHERFRPAAVFLGRLVPLGLIAGLAAWPALAPAQPAGGSYIADVQRLVERPVIDGRLDERAWQGVPVLGGFTQLVPDEGAPASERTEVRLGFDDESLYLGFRCFDREPSQVVANILKRDEDLSYDDSVNVVLDTYADGQNGFLFAANALGARFDAVVRKEGEEINVAWDGLWWAAGARDDAGFTVEMRIPFKTLRFPKSPEQNWGLNLGRFVARRREEAFWRPMRKDFGFNAKYKLSEYGRLTGLRGVKQGLHLELKPRLLAERRDGQDPSAKGGVDAKLNLASNLVADVTVKTDFAEAEADELQLNLTRFRLFYPEKRAFFLEGADLFYVGERPEPYKPPELSLFFSRRIGLTDDATREVPLLGGAKVTGKLAGLAVGLLNVTTQRLATPDTLLAPRTNFSVARLRQDVFGKSSVGVLALDKRATGGADNRLAGADWDFALRDNLHTGGFLAKTATPGLTGGDWAGHADVFYDGRHARARAAYYDVGENFNDELGFVPRTGMRRAHSALTGLLWPKRGHLRQVLATHYFDYVTDRQGHLQTRLHDVEFGFIFQNSSGIAAKWFEEKEVLARPFEVRRGVVVPAGEHVFRWLFFGYQTDYSKPFGFTVWLQDGDYYDGRLFLTLQAITWRPLPGLLSQFVFQHTHVTVSGGEFTTDQLTGEANYALRPNLAARATLQWRRGDTLRVNAALNFEYRPGSNLYLVYNETRLEPDGVTTTRDRSLVFKATYTLGF